MRFVSHHWTFPARQSGATARAKSSSAVRVKACGCRQWAPTSSSSSQHQPSQLTTSVFWSSSSRFFLLCSMSFSITCQEERSGSELVLATRERRRFHLASVLIYWPDRRHNSLCDCGQNVQWRFSLHAFVYSLEKSRLFYNVMIKKKN